MGTFGVSLFLLETNWTANLHFEHSFTFPASFAVLIKLRKWGPMLKMSRAALMHLLESKAFKKSRANSASDLFFWLNRILLKQGKSWGGGRFQSQINIDGLMLPQL